MCTQRIGSRHSGAVLPFEELVKHWREANVLQHQPEISVVQGQFQQQPVRKSHAVVCVCV